MDFGELHAYGTRRAAPSTMRHLHDITEHKRADSSRTTLSHGVHELRTPLTVMLGSLITATTPGISAEDRQGC